MAGDPSGDRVVSRPGGQGAKFYVLSSEPKEHKSFCPDTRPGRPVTGATGKSFMCKNFMCLFCSLFWEIALKISRISKIRTRSTTTRDSNSAISQERKISPKRKFWGRISRGHTGVIRADIPAQNFGQGVQNPGKNKHLGADIHDPKARTSTTLREFQKLRSEKLWAEFSFPNFGAPSPLDFFSFCEFSPLDFWLFLQVFCVSS